MRAKKDQLLTRKQDVIYQMLNWPQKSNIICIGKVIIFFLRRIIELYKSWSRKYTARNILVMTVNNVLALMIIPKSYLYLKRHFSEVIRFEKYSILLRCNYKRSNIEYCVSFCKTNSRQIICPNFGQISY